MKAKPKMPKNGQALMEELVRLVEMRYPEGSSCKAATKDGRRIRWLRHWLMRPSFMERFDF